MINKNITENKNIFKAFIKAQSEFVEVYKNTKGHGYKYATLGALMNMVRPILNKHGIAIIQNPFTCTIEDKKNVGVVTTLIHESGEMLQSEPLHCPIDIGGMRMTAYQTLGVGITYLKRYQLGSFLGVESEEDTDGVTDKQIQPEKKPTKQTKQEMIQTIKKLAKEKGINPEQKKKLEEYTNTELENAIQKLNTI